LPKPKSPYANKPDPIIVNCVLVHENERCRLMKKLAIVSIVLLLAGIGLGFGQAEQSACGAQCPDAGCGGEGGCQACCGDNCAACCGNSTTQTQSAPVTSACAVQCPSEGCDGEGGCQACCGDNCAACCGSSTAENTAAISACGSGNQCPKGGCEVAGGCQACCGSNCGANRTACCGAANS
jgi:hypothetical protein